MKVILCLTIGLILLSGGALLRRAKTSASRQQTPADIQRAKNEQKLRDKFHDHIASAKAEGRRELVIIVEGVPSDVTSIEQVIRDYSLVRVKVKDKETTVSDSDGSLQTWYKLDVLEVLRRGFHKKCVNGHNAWNNFRGKDRLWLSRKKSSMNF